MVNYLIPVVPVHLARIEFSGTAAKRQGKNRWTNTPTPFFVTDNLRTVELAIR